MRSRQENSMARRRNEKSVKLAVSPGYSRLPLVFLTTISLFLFPFPSLHSESQHDFSSIKNASLRQLRLFVKDKTKTDPETLKARLATLDTSIPVDSPEYDKVLVLKLYAAFYSNRYKKAFSIISELDSRIGKGGFDLVDFIRATRVSWHLTFYNCGKDVEALKLLGSWRKALNGKKYAYWASKIDFNIIRLAERSGKYDQAMSALERVASHYLDKANPRWSFAFYYSDFDKVTAMLKDKTRPIALLKRLRKLGEKRGRPLFALLADKRLAMTRRMIESPKGFESEGAGKWTSDAAKAKSEPAFAYKPLLILHVSPSKDDLTVKEKDLIKLVPLLTDDDFIPVRDCDPKFKDKAFLETVTKNGTVAAITLQSTTIPSLIKFFNKALLEFHQNATLPLIVRSDAYSLKYLGKAYELAGRNELAELFYGKFIEIAPNPHQVIMTKRDLVSLAMTKKEEKRRLIEVLPEAMANVDKCVTCPMYVLIGLMKNSSGTPDARKWLDKAAEFEKKYASRDKNLRYYFNIFKTKEKLHRLLLAGDDRDAGDFVKKLHATLVKEPNFWGKGEFFSEIELELGEFKLYDHSIDFALAGARAYENCGNLKDAARMYHNLGVQYGNTGMTGNAKDAYAQALRLGKIINDKHRVGDVLRQLAGLLSDDKKSLAMLEKSRAYLSATLAFPCLINTLLYLVRKKADMGLFKEANLSLDELRRATELWGNEFPYVNAKAHVLKKEGKFDQAISLLEKTLAEKGDKLKPLEIDRFQAMLGDTCYDAKFYSEALKWYGRNIAQFENSRGLLSTQARKSALSSKNFDTYEYAFDCAVRCDNKKKAFEIMEKSRARAFLDLLAEKIAKGRITLAHDASEFVDSKLSAPAVFGGNPLLVMNPNLQGVPRDLEVVVRNPPKALLSMVAANPPLLKDFQKILPENTLVVEYFTTKMKSHVWLVTSRNVTLIPIDIAYSELADLAEKWVDQLKTSPGSGERTKIGKRLYDLLWAPVARFAESKKIVIIPHRILHSLPFHVLRDGKRRFLCENNEIVRAASTASLEILADRQRKSNKTIAFGNPLVESGFELPHSEKEAKIAASHFKSETFLRGEATETAFKTRSPNAGVIHLACHAFFDKYSPLDSFALLKRDSRNDGMLKTTEIFNLNLRKHPLVVLSACKSAKGSMTDGDDLIGLSSAFFCAGASEIIATLWSVDDKATERVMRSFYRHFAESQNAAKALTAMRRDMIKEKMPLKNWAPFVLIGGCGQTKTSKTSVNHVKNHCPVFITSKVTNRIADNDVEIILNKINLRENEEVKDILMNDDTKINVNIGLKNNNLHGRCVEMTKKNGKWILCGQGVWDS